MGKSQRTKGATFERAAVNIAKAYGLESRRTAPMQAGYGDADDSDILIHGAYHPFVNGAFYPPEAMPIHAECKNRQDISGRLWKWLSGNDLLIIKRNGEIPLAVLPYTEYLLLVGGSKPEVK